MLRIALIANLPPPHWVPIYQRIAAIADVELKVIFCSAREPNRPPATLPMDYNHTFLRERFITVDGRHIHNNPDVIAKLKKFSPDVIVTNGFSPTHLYAFFYSMLGRLVHVPMTDSTDCSESMRGPVHRAVRRFIYQRSPAFLTTSKGGRRLYQSYGVTPDRCFTSHPSVDNDAFSCPKIDVDKKFDFIFSGPLEVVRNPLFAFDVALDTAKKLNRAVRILFVGTGRLEHNVKQLAARHRDLVHAEFTGFVTQQQLPALYRSARIMLFPTRGDSWGVAANEACAAGLPVIVTPAAGVAGELVFDGENGYVNELSINQWSDHATMLLTKSSLYQRFSERSRSIVKNYTLEKSAVAFVEACRHALQANGKHAVNDQHAARPTVVIVERNFLHYRVAVYQRLRELLAAEGVNLQLLIGEGTPEEMQKRDQTRLDWTITMPTRYFLRNKICWLPFGSYAKSADLVVLMHENKLIYNLWLLFFSRPRRIAFWGHGRNMQSKHPDGWRERFKRWTVNKVDWWFAYTEGSAALVNDAGFPRSRTTVVENAIDTKEMTALCRAIPNAERERLRLKLGIGGGKVGLYVGSLYEEKRVGFLLEAAKEIRQQIPDFHLVVVGAGPDQAMVEAAVQEHSWIHYLGPLQGKKKAEAMVIADVMLNPGLVGLGILDSFINGTPMFTTDCGLHSPEIEYLNSGTNGVMTADTLRDYTSAIVKVLMTPAAFAKLREGALASSTRYTVENMATRICNGIMSCLATD